MSSQTQKRRPGAAVQAKNDAPKAPSAKITRIAVGVDGHPEGRDAVALGRAIAGSTGAELMLVAVQPDSLVPMPREMGRAALRKEAEKMLREVRDSLAPDEGSMSTPTSRSPGRFIAWRASTTGTS